MNADRILVLVLVGALLAPAASAGVTGQTDSAAARSPIPTPAEPVTGGENRASQKTNYTRLYIEDEYQGVRLKPGENRTVNITVENGDDEAVTLSPHVFIPRRGERPIEKEWVEIEDGNMTLAPDEERTITVTVSVPNGTELGEYDGAIALTDERITYPGRPARPVHAARLSVEVWKEPTVRILSERYLHTQVQAGETTTHRIVIENTGEQAVPLNPEVTTEERRRPHEFVHAEGGQRNTVDPSWFAVEAPAEIEPGETVTVTVTAAPPADADRGRYEATVDLGLKDPNRPEQEGHWQRIDVNLQVWTQPEEPFTTNVTVSDDAKNLRLRLSTDDHRASGGGKAASFDVAFVAPNGTVVDAERVKRTDSGYVNLGAERERPRTLTDGPYAVEGGQQQFVYRLSDPQSGEWTVRIMPHNTVEFGYEIVRNEG